MRRSCGLGRLGIAERVTHRAAQRRVERLGRARAADAEAHARADVVAKALVIARAAPREAQPELAERQAEDARPACEGLKGRGNALGRSGGGAIGAGRGLFGGGCHWDGCGLHVGRASGSWYETRRLLAHGGLRRELRTIGFGDSLDTIFERELDYEVAEWDITLRIKAPLSEEETANVGGGI